MRIGLAALTVLIAMPLQASAQNRPIDDRLVIERAKQADVSTLDATLKKQRFDDWLAGVVGANAKVTWGVTDCGEGTGSPADRGRDMPICAEVVAKLPDGRQAAINLAMGSHQKGISPAPYGMYAISVMQNGQPVFFKTLSALGARLRTQLSALSTRSLTWENLHA